MNKAFFTNIEQVLLSNIKNAKTTIKVAVAWFSNSKLFDLLLDKQKSGIQVQLIMSDDIRNVTNHRMNLEDLARLGGLIRVSQTKFMHHKFCIIDDRILITGSYNWTQKAENQNLENVILSTDLSLILQFKEEYDKLTQKTNLITNIAKSEFKQYEDTENIFILDNEVVDEKQFEMPYLDEYENNDEDAYNESALELYSKAELLYRQAKYSDALSIIEQVKTLKPNFSKVYELISTIYWRKKEYKKQIDAALTAIKYNNLNYEAYNMLGIGYSAIGDDKKSIEQYKICISAEPEEYNYYWNRGLSYQTILELPNFPPNLKEQYKKKAKEDFEKTIELTNKQESQLKEDYHLFNSRGQAKLLLGKFVAAKQDLKKALDWYKKSPKEQQDTHIFKEINESLKRIK